MCICVSQVFSVKRGDLHKQPGEKPTFANQVPSLSSRTYEPYHLHPEEAQDQSEATHAFHHVPAPSSGAQVPPETVPLHCRACRVLQLSEPHRDPGQNLVPEPKGQGEKTAGGRTGKAENGCKTYAALWLQSPFPYQLAPPSSIYIWNLLPFPQTCASHPARRTLCHTSRIWHVPSILRKGRLTDSTWMFVSEGSFFSPRRLH